MGALGCVLCRGGGGDWRHVPALGDGPPLRSLVGAGDALVAPLGAAARLFHALAPAYHATTIGKESDEYEPPRDDEGEELSLESVVSQLLELIMCLVEHPKLRTLLRDGMEDTIHRAIGYMCMTAAQEEAWEDDPNAYVADEDDDMTTRTTLPRHAATCALLATALVACERTPSTETARATPASASAQPRPSPREEGAEMYGDGQAGGNMVGGPAT